MARCTRKLVLGGVHCWKWLGVRHDWRGRDERENTAWFSVAHVLNDWSGDRNSGRRGPHRRHGVDRRKGSWSSVRDCRGHCSSCSGGADAKGSLPSCHPLGEAVAQGSSPLKDTCHRGARPTAVRGPIDRVAMSSVVSWHGPFLSTAGLNTTRVISSHVHSPQQGHANRGATPPVLPLSWRPAPRKDSPRAVGTATLKSALKPGRCKFRNFSSRSLARLASASSCCAMSNERELCGHDLRGSGSGVRGSLLLNDRRSGRNLRLLGCHGWQHHRRRGCKRSRIEAAAPLERCSSGEPFTAVVGGGATTYGASKPLQGRRARPVLQTLHCALATYLTVGGSRTARLALAPCTQQ